MALRPERPLIVLPQPVSVPSPPPPLVIGKGPKGPKKGRQLERLGPDFEALQEALDRKRLELKTDSTGVTPELVLVFETNGPIKEFYEALQTVPGFAWMAEDELRDLEPDDDFFFAGKPDKQVGARLYLAMTNDVALQQLLSLWGLWKKNKRLGIHAGWTKVFGKLRSVRRWSVEDRLRDTGVLEEWKRRVDDGWETVTAEVELWFRDAADRTAAAARLTSAVQAAGGTVLSTCLIEEISYHAMMARLPIQVVKQILADRSVGLLKVDDVHLFRPTPQAWTRPASAEPLPSERVAPPAGSLGEPIVALLDGLPIENHQWLAGRLRVDDPDGWSAKSPVRYRVHGTAMASLILHGDLSLNDAPLSRQLYVRPILRSHSFNARWEKAPEDLLWLDVIHRAVLRAVVGEGAIPPAAPNVRIFSLSVGDSYQPFIEVPSPLAKLLDWLSWKHKVLFSGSAGNHLAEYNLTATYLATTESREIAVFGSLRAGHRLRRLLAPAESINAITVGATEDDAAGPWKPLVPGESTLLETPGLPSTYTALGRGHLRSIKPDILAPGGRLVFVPPPNHTGNGPAVFAPNDGRSDLMPPGQRVAAPSASPGVLNGMTYMVGTSNSAALTTRLAAQIAEAVLDLQADPGGELIVALPLALVTKALLVHTAEWSEAAFDVLTKALRTPKNASTFKDEVTAFMGYGHIRPARATACTPERVTLISGGVLRPGETLQHAVPLPACLHMHAAWRRLTTTLAWFTPTRPGRRKYRCASLNWDVPTAKDDSPLRVKREQVHGNAVGRGTVRHDVLEGDRQAINLPDGTNLPIEVTCFEDAPCPDVAIPYALAVSLEVAPQLKLPIYDQVSTLVRAQVALGVKPR